MKFLIGLLAFFAMLGVIIMIHEAGHFLAARAFGVHCHEFSFGMGPALWQKQGKNTLFSIRALPIGGYVSMAGEAEQEDEDPDSWIHQIPDSEKLNNKPAWQQMIVMAAGVFMNLLLALVLTTVILQVQGRVSQPAEPVIYEVMEGTPAFRAGLMSGDRIVKITASDGSVLEPKTQMEVNEFLQYNHGLSTFDIQRGDEIFTTQIQPELNEESQVYLLGFTSQAGVRSISFFEAIPEAFRQIQEDIALMFRSIATLFQGKGLDSLSGPVGIYKVTDQVVSYGFLPYLSLCSLISLNIGIFNLLPIPALDGGRILILALERIFRRKIPLKIIEGVIMASFMLLFALMIFSTYNDISRFFF